jgi:hypothetical protein
MKSGVTVTKDRVLDLLKAVRELRKTRVLVGIPDSTAERDPEPGEPNKMEPTEAQIGYWMEFGVPSQNVPARPFLVPGVQKAMNKIIPEMNKAAEGALRGDTAKVDAAITRIGEFAVTSVKEGILNGVPPPLAPATLARRRARGSTRETPLVDTGAFLNSITYVVTKTGSGTRRK